MAVIREITKPKTSTRQREPSGRLSRAGRHKPDPGTTEIRARRLWKAGALTSNEYNLVLTGVVNLDSLSLAPHDDPGLTTTTLGTLRCRGLIGDHHHAAGVEYLKLRTMLFGAAAARARDNEATFGSGGSGLLGIDTVRDEAAEAITRKFARGTMVMSNRQREAITAIVVEDKVPGMLGRILSGERPFTVADLVEMVDLMSALEVLTKAGFSARPEED
jgi:hypothetical protein